MFSLSNIDWDHVCCVFSDKHKCYCTLEKFLSVSFFSNKLMKSPVEFCKL